MMAQVKKKVTDQKVKIKLSSNNTVQSIYADTVVQIGIGPFVSRAMLGSEVGAGEVAPIMQLIMPSNALLSFAQNVIKLFAQGDTVKKMQGHLVKFQGEITSLDTKFNIPPEK